MELDHEIEILARKVCEKENRQLRRLSKTFWQGLDVKRRTKEKVAEVNACLIKHGLIVKLDKGKFGSEDESVWLVIQYHGIPFPDDAWFESMSQKVFDNETEVKIFFLSPLFQKLGYSELDFYFEYPVKMPRKFQGRRAERIETRKADLALMNGTAPSETNILVLTEVKMPDYLHPERNEAILKGAESENKVYLSQLKQVNRWVVTNGHDLLAYKLPETLENQIPFTVHRGELKDKWPELFIFLGKPILLEERSQMPKIGET